MKKPIIITDTFKTIDLPNGKNPIVICDIDLTFIRPTENYIDIYNQMKPLYSDPKQLNKVVCDMLNSSIDFGVVKHTDYEGFLKMLERINLLEGKFLFLTARSASFHEKTINDLKTAGLQNPEEFEIHYTGNLITKGQYILIHNLLQGYDHHVFIDDYPYFLESALQIYPDMNCYLFKYK